MSEICDVQFQSFEKITTVNLTCNYLKIFAALPSLRVQLKRGGFENGDFGLSISLVVTGNVYFCVCFLIRMFSNLTCMAPLSMHLSGAFNNL